MNLQNLVVVVLRLMSLNFLFGVSVQLTPYFIQFYRMSSRSPDEESMFLMLVFALILGGLVLSAVLLWVLAPRIARLATRRLPQDVSFGVMSLVDCYSLAFIGVGLFYIVGHLPQVLYWAFYSFKAAAATPTDSWKNDVSGYGVWQAFVPFIVGVVLFVNGRKWAVKLGTRQTADSSPADTTGQD
jgi:hypothetical protein